MEEIKIELEHNKFRVSICENGFQWHTIYRNPDLDKAEMIEKAFIKVGYKRKTHN